MKICTEEDWLKFHKPNKFSIDRINKFKQSKVAYCFNSKDIYGKPFLADPS